MKYIVVKALQVPTGTMVSVSKEQAAARGPAQLRHVKGSMHEALQPVWFKAGETVGIDAPAKHLLASLDAGSKAASVQSGQPSPLTQPDLDTLPRVEVSTDGTE